jgi:flagellar motor switch protein FliG
MPLTGREKATIFLSILGGETAARVLRYLPNELADLIASSLNHLPSPSPDALAEVLNDLKGFLALPSGGEGGQLPQQIAPPPVSSPPATRSRQQYQVLVYERPQLIAFLLSQLPPLERDEALLSLPREKPILVQLLGHLKKNHLQEKLAEKLRGLFQNKLFFEAAV